MKRENYKGKRKGLTAEKAMIGFAVLFIVLTLMTTKAASEWTGQSGAELLREAVFTEQDWS